MAYQKYEIPPVINPPETCYVCVPVPNDDTHIRNFMGAIMSLCVWYNYERDVDESGRQLAEVWREVRDCVLAQLGDEV